MIKVCLALLLGLLSVARLNAASTFEWSTTGQIPGGPDYTWYLPVLVQQTTVQDALRVRDQNGNLRMNDSDETTIVWAWNPVTQGFVPSVWDAFEDEWWPNVTLYPGSAMYIQICTAEVNETLTIHLNGTRITGQFGLTIRPGGNLIGTPDGGGCASELGAPAIPGDILYFYLPFPGPTQSGSDASVFDPFELAWAPDNCASAGSVIYFHSAASTNRTWTVTY